MYQLAPDIQIIIPSQKVGFLMKMLPVSYHDKKIYQGVQRFHPGKNCSILYVVSSFI
jgi:hypothetical protein